MAETTTISFRVETSKKEELSKVLDALDVSQREALESAVDHINNRYSIIPKMNHRVLERRTNKLIHKLESKECLITEKDIESIPLGTKLAVLSSILEWSREAHPSLVKRLNRELNNEYEHAPSAEDLNLLNPFDLGELQEIDENPDIQATDFYHSPERLELPVKIRFLVLVAEKLLETDTKERFLEATVAPYGEETPIQLTDDEIGMKHNQNRRNNTLGVEITLPFEPAVDD